MAWFCFSVDLFSISLLTKDLTNSMQVFRDRCVQISKRQSYKQNFVLKEDKISLKKDSALPQNMSLQ